MDDALKLIHGINQYIINPIIALMFAAAVLVFLFGLLEYFVAKDNSSSARETGRNHMLAGVIGIFIMISVFGIINVILNTVGATRSETNIDKIIK
jgi:hypothetical protein